MLDGAPRLNVFFSTFCNTTCLVELSVCVQSVARSDAAAHLAWLDSWFGCCATRFGSTESFWFNNPSRWRSKARSRSRPLKTKIPLFYSPKSQVQPRPTSNWGWVWVPPFFEGSLTHYKKYGPAHYRKNSRLLLWSLKQAKIGPNSAYSAHSPTKLSWAKVSVRSATHSPFF